MKKAILQRQSKDSLQVLGQITCETLSVFTLEKLETLVDAGTYLCKYTRSPRLSALALQHWLARNPTLKAADAPDDVKDYFTYELQNVHERTGIRLHSDSFSSELEGCIAPCLSYDDINSDGELDGISSKMAVQKLEDFMGRLDFELVIIDIPTT